MAWCSNFLIFVNVMAVPGLSRFIDYNAHNFYTHPIPHNYPPEQSLQLSAITQPYVQPYPQQVSHVYTPPENTYRGFTYQTLDIYGGISQVGFMTGSEANSLLQDSLKALTTVDIPEYKLTLDKTINDEQSLSKNTGKQPTFEAVTQLPAPEQNFITNLKNEDTSSPPQGYYFPPIQVNHFQAGASYIAPPFFNPQPDFMRQFGFLSVTDNSETKKLTSDNSADNNGLRNSNEIAPINNDSSNTSLLESKESVSQDSTELRSIDNVENEDSVASLNSEALSVSDKNLITTTETNNETQSNEESSTLNDDITSTTKDEDLTTTNKPDSSEDSENNSNRNLTNVEDDSVDSDTSETTSTPMGNATEENSTTESSE